MKIGRYALVVGDPDGTAIERIADRGDARPLIRAIAHRRKREHSRGPSESLEKGVDDADEVADKIELALTLFREIAEHRIDASSIGDQVNALLDLLQRLDREKRWTEALRLARALSKLLAVTLRWIELLRSLREALDLAERLGDDDGKAWALHELGTLHLAAEKREQADRMLTMAHEIRAGSHDRHGQAVTDRNLEVVCRTLKDRLGKPNALEQIMKRPALALALAAALIVAGGIAGAVAFSSHHPSPLEPVAEISITPAHPRAGEQIAFRAVTKTPADPYVWWFDDGSSSSQAKPKHTYKEERHYRVIVTVTDKRGAIVATGTRTIFVAKKLISPPPPPTVEISVHAGSSPAEAPIAEKPVTFTAIASAAKGESIVRYLWNFGDSAKGEGRTQVHEYTNPQAYNASVLVTDSRGATTRVSRTVVVKERPSPKHPSRITVECPSASVPFGERITIHGVVTPAPAPATVTISYTTLSGKPLAETTSTDAKGAYRGATRNFEPGEWTVSSSWPGNSEYSSAESSCTLVVEPPNVGREG